MSDHALVQYFAPPSAQAPDDPRWEIRIGLTVAAVFFVGFLGWSAFAPLDAAAFVSGTVTASGGPQGVQSREGGVVQAIHVHEGQHVAKGQPLLDLASEDVRTTVRALSARVMARRAELMRLEAERADEATVKPWVGFNTLAGEDAAEAHRALAVEQENLTARLEANKTAEAVLAQRVIQGRQQMIGTQRELSALQIQGKTIDSELSGMKSLAAKGYAPRLQVSELERTAAGLEGSIGSRQSDVARLSSSVGEAQLQITDQQLRRRQTIADDMRTAQDDLRALEPQLATAKEVLRRAEVNSPAAGRVFAMKTNTIGGVAGPGEVLMRIVPDSKEVMIEGKVQTRDAADVMAGQIVEIRFPAFHQRNAPMVQGVIQRMSADSYQDDRTGAQYFKIDVKVEPKALEELNKVRGASQALSPGLTADVMVKLRKRTALQYAFEPLMQTFSKSFHEH
jgi:HlyD family type I secretion membrane fusion protein